MQIIPDSTNKAFSSLLQVFREESSLDRTRSIQEGGVIEGIKASERFLFLKSGIIRVCINSGASEILLGIFKPGDLIDCSLFSTDLQNYALKALTSTEVGMFGFQNMDDLINLSPKMKLLENELKDSWMSFLGKRFCMVMLKKPIERVTDLISEYLCIQELQGSNLWNTFSLNDLASYCNMAEEEFKYYYKKLIITGQLKLNEKSSSVLYRGKITI